MASLVALALSVKERVQMEELERDVIVLLNDVLTLKSDYIESVRDCFVKLMSPLNSKPYISDFATFVNTFQNISDEYSKAKPTPSFSQDQLENLSLILNEVNENLNVIKQVMDIDQLLCTAKDFYKDEEFLECTKTLYSCKTLFEKPPCSGDIDDIITAMRRDFVLICENVMHLLNALCREFISFKDKPCTSGNDHKIVQLNVSLKAEGKFLKVLKALQYLYLQNFKFKSLGSMLLEHIFRPIVEHECAVKIEENTREEIASLEVTLDENSSNPIYKIVLHNLKLAFEFLDAHFNYEISENVKLLTLVGQFTSQSICELAFRMGSFNSKQIEIYTDDIQSTENFKNFLYDVGFMQIDTCYQEKVHPEIFEYLQCCKVIKEATNVMHKRTYDSIEVVQKSQYFLELPVIKNGELLQGCDKLTKRLNISKSTHELMDLLFKSLEEASQKNRFESQRHFDNFVNILEFYNLLLPLECQESAKESAHLSAIIFNNCSHLCERVVLLSLRYYEHFPKLGNDHVVTFTSVAINIRQTGEDILHSYVESQIEKLGALINESDFNTEEFFKQEKAVERCLNNFKILKTTWLNLLPHFVYLTAIGVIMQSTIKCLLMKVMLQPKISPELAFCIRTLLQDMVKGMKNDFSEEELSNVSYISKLFSVKMVLERNASEIVHKWKLGKGELAKNLTSAELEQLVTAVFEGDELRFILNQIQ